LAKIGPGSKLEATRLLVVDRESGDVRRLQVGCALDARVHAAVDAAGNRAERMVFAVPGTSSKST
jgi:hypothetical protein